MQARPSWAYTVLEEDIQCKPLEWLGPDKAMSTAHMHGPPPPGKIGRRSPWGYFCMMSYKHGIFFCSASLQRLPKCGWDHPLVGACSVLGCAGCWLLARWCCPSSSSRLGIVIHFPV